MNVSKDQIELLKQFVQLCKSYPSILKLPDLKFYKDWIESIGGKIPDANVTSDENVHTTSSGDADSSDATTNKPSENSEPMDSTPPPQEDDATSETDESDLELDNLDVIEADDATTNPLEMGDNSIEVTEDNIDGSNDKRREAIDATNENRLDDAVGLYTEAIKLNPLSAALFAKRASVLLKLNRPNAAIIDSTHAIELNPDSAIAYKWRGLAHRRLGHWVEAYNDWNLSNKIDYDEMIIEWLKEIESNARKLLEHKRKYERLHEQHEIDQRKARVRKAREEYEKQRKSESSSGGFTGGMPGGFPGGMPGGFPGGMPDGMSGGSPGAMPDISKILSDPDLMAAFQDPEVMAAFQDVSTNPANMSKYEDNPKIKRVIEKLGSKFGGGKGPDFGCS